jgi:hypothetical protein
LKNRDENGRLSPKGDRWFSKVRNVHVRGFGGAVGINSKAYLIVMRYGILATATPPVFILFKRVIKN